MTTTAISSPSTPSFGTPDVSDCCDIHPPPGVGTAQRRVLTIVLVINAVMFVGAALAALFAGSSSLLSGSIDNLGDALTYALSLWAVSRGAKAKARVSLFKGLLILAAGVSVAAHVVYKLANPAVPVFEVMGAFTLLGLAANAVCLILLSRHRHEDINMASVWECSRNDVIENLAVLVAAIAVWVTAAQWPDTLVAVALVVLLLRSAVRMIRRSVREIRAG